MTILNNTLQRFVLLAVMTCSLLCNTAPAEATAFEVIDFDPVSGSVIDMRDRLYIKIAYESDIPIRFQMSAKRQGVPFEMGAKADPGVLIDSGSGVALAWLQFLNPTHIDEIQVTVYNAEWRLIDKFSAKVDLAWQDLQTAQAREPAAWVRVLQKEQRRKSDFFFDPQPEKQDKVYDFLFMLSVTSLPIYLFIQVQMLRRYRGRWRELALVPLVTFMPLVLFTLTGGGIGSEEWIIFVFRYSPFALFLLIMLWVIKRVKTGEPPEQKDS